MRQLLQLYIESVQYARSGNGSSRHIFKTLVRLYVKSKFSKRDNSIVKHTIGSFTFHSYNYSTLIELYREIFLKQVYKSESLSDTPYIIDCGSNIGFSVLYFKQQYPNAEIWAFEPNPHSFFLLETNMRENNIKGVQLFNCALSDTAGAITFYAPQNKSSLNGSSIQLSLPSDKILVPSKKLSETLAGRNVDLIKIDIEGDELKVIRDLDENNLLPSVQKFVIEYHHTSENSSASFSDFLNVFQKNNFTFALRSVEDGEVGKQNVVITFERK